MNSSPFIYVNIRFDSISFLSSSVRSLTLVGVPGGITRSFHITMAELSTARGRSALAVSIVFTSLATIFLAIRIYTRAFLAKQLGGDDYTIIVALVRS